MTYPVVPSSVGTHYLRGVNNARQPWHSAEGRLQYGLRPANPTEEGLASLHSVLFRKQPFLWRAALLYYTIHRASRMSFRQLFQDLARYVQDADVRWEYCVRAKRGQTDTSLPGGRPRGVGVGCPEGGVGRPEPGLGAGQASGLGTHKPSLAHRLLQQGSSVPGWHRAHSAAPPDHRFPAADLTGQGEGPRTSRDPSQPSLSLQCSLSL